MKVSLTGYLLSLETIFDSFGHLNFNVWCPQKGRIYLNKPAAESWSLFNYDLFVDSRRWRVNVEILYGSLMTKGLMSDHFGTLFISGLK